MYCYLIERVDNVSYVEDYAIVVIAKDKLCAERLARVNSDDFRKAKVRVKKIDMSKEQVILIANTGS